MRRKHGAVPRMRWLAAVVLSLLPLAASAVTREEICGRTDCTARTSVCAAATRCRDDLATRVQTYCGFSAPRDLCLSDADVTCMSGGSCGVAPSGRPAGALCCRCQTANPTRSVCVRNITDLPPDANCADLPTRSGDYHRVSTGRPAFEGFSCASTALTEAQCRTVAEGGVCGGSDFYAQAIASVPELWTALRSHSIEDIRKIGGVTGPTTATAPRPFVSITPQLGVSIPGLTFSPATQEDGETSVLFLAQYIAAIYRYAVRIVVIVAMVMVVYGGFRYLVGSAFEQIQRGKEIIVDAVIGMLLVLGAFTILQTINPATLDLSAIRLKSIEPVPFKYDEELEFDTGRPEGGAPAVAPAPGAPPGPMPSRPAPMPLPAPSGVSTNVPNVPVSSFKNITNHPCMRASDTHPVFEPMLRRVGDRFCQLRGARNWTLLCGGFRPLRQQALWSLQRCLNRQSCTVATCNNFPPNLFTRIPDPRASGKTILVTANPSHRSLSPSQVFDEYWPTILSDELSARLRCPHTSGVAVDCSCVIGGRIFGVQSPYVPCQLMMEQAFRAVGGICRLAHESWHFEPNDYRVTMRSCILQWPMGSVTHHGRTDNYASTCPNGIYHYSSGSCTAAPAGVTP